MSRKPMTSKRLIGLMGLAFLVGAVAFALLIGGLFAALILAPGPSAAHMEAVANDLDIPPDWELAHTTIKAPGTLDGCIRAMDTTCPSVTRFYYVGSQPLEAYRDAKEMLATAGFHVDEEFHSTCGSASSGSACSFYASSDRAVVDVGVHYPGSGGGDGVVPTDPGRSLIRLIVRGPGTYPPGRRTSPPASPTP
jgi:hypothetical protein